MPLDRPEGQRIDSRTVLERVRELNGVTWEWTDRKYARDKRQRAIGLIAQDVQRVFPEAVSTDRRGYLMVHYAGLVGVLVEAVKELTDRVEALERRLHERGSSDGTVR